MSKMFDYITDKATGKVAELEASLEHMGGHLGIQIEENERLTNEVERLRAALEETKKYLNEHGLDAWEGTTEELLAKIDAVLQGEKG